MKRNVDRKIALFKNAQILMDHRIIQCSGVEIPQAHYTLYTNQGSHGLIRRFHRYIFPLRILYRNIYLYVLYM